MMGVHNSLSPVLISNYECDFELIVVETKVGRKQIRLITGYWPQEDWDDEHRAPFFMALDKEISNALADRKSVFVAMGVLNIFHKTQTICPRMVKF